MKQELYELRWFIGVKELGVGQFWFFVAARDDSRILPQSRQSCFRTATEFDRCLLRDCRERNGCAL